jgi:hypothetical protein
MSSSQSTQGLDAGAKQDRDTTLGWIIMIVLVLAGLLALGLSDGFPVRVKLGARDTRGKTGA